MPLTTPALLAHHVAWVGTARLLHTAALLCVLLQLQCRRRLCPSSPPTCPRGALQLTCVLYPLRLLCPHTPLGPLQRAQLLQGRQLPH